MINNLNDVSIKCPECDHSFEISEDLISAGIRNKIENEIKLKNEKKLAIEVENKVKIGVQAELEPLYNKISKLQSEKIEIEKNAKIDQKKEDEETIRKLKIENIQIFDQFEAIKSEKDLLEKTIESETDSKIRIALAEQRRELLNKNDLEKNSLIKENETLKSDIDNLKKRSDQGSVQLQGEIGETFIEDTLRQNFPKYAVQEIKKGQKGADCILNISENGFNNSIIFESKLTKKFDAKWIDKLENDIKIKGAIYGILVTDVMPSERNEPFLENNIWVCQFHDFLIITRGVIELVSKVNKIKSANKITDNQAREMFNYLTGPKFASTINLLLRPINTMSEQLNSEKRAFTKQWLIREKAIDRVFDAVALLHGEISSIGGPGLPDIKGIPNVEFLENKKFDDEI